MRTREREQQDNNIINIRAANMLKIRPLSTCVLKTCAMTAADGETLAHARDTNEMAHNNIRTAVWLVAKARAQMNTSQPP